MVLKSTKRSGKNTLAYLGVEASTPPNLFTLHRAPTTTDNATKGFFIGDLCIDRSTDPRDVYIMVDLADNIATWVKLGNSTVGTDTYVTNNGTATSVAGYLNVFGDSLINTSASGNTVNVNLTNGLAGQVLIGSDTGSPVWAYITSTGGSLAITNLDNAIEIETTGVAALDHFTADDLNTASPDGLGVVNFVGSTNITTYGDGLHTLTIDLKDDVTIANSLTLSAQASGVLQTSIAGEVFSSKGTDGQVLIGGGTEPNWANITSADGSMIITNDANSINVEVKPGYPTRPVEFMAIQPTTVLQILGGAETYLLGTSSALVEKFDVGGDLYPGNGVGAYAVFTAPISGKYYLHMAVKIQTYAGAPVPIVPLYDPDIRIITTNKEYALISNEDTYTFATSYFYDKWKHISIVTEMAAGDTAIYYVQCNVGNSGSLNIGGSSVYQTTYVDGYYVG